MKKVFALLLVIAMIASVSLAFAGTIEYPIFGTWYYSEDNESQTYTFGFTENKGLSAVHIYVFSNHIHVDEYNLFLDIVDENVYYITNNDTACILTLNGDELVVRSLYDKPPMGEPLTMTFKRIK